MDTMIDNQEAWFEFCGHRPDDLVYGWGTRDEAEEYRAHLNARIIDSERRWVVEQVTEAKRSTLGLDERRDDAFNLGDLLIDVLFRSEAA